MLCEQIVDRHSRIEARETPWLMGEIDEVIETYWGYLIE